MRGFLRRVSSNGKRDSTPSKGRDSDKYEEGERMEERAKLK